jgi:hypothetical protein
MAQQMAADPETQREPYNGEIGRGRNSSDNIRPISSKHGTSAEYLVRRLKRDAPKIAEALALLYSPRARAAVWAEGWGIGFIVNPIRNLFPSRRHDCDKSKPPTTTSRGS